MSSCDLRRRRCHYYCCCFGMMMKAVDRCYYCCCCWVLPLLVWLEAAVSERGASSERREEGKKGREANQRGVIYLQKRAAGLFAFVKSTSLTFLSEQTGQKFKLLFNHSNGGQFSDNFWVAVASPEQIGINPNVDLCRLSLILQESKSRGASIGAAVVIKLKRTLLQPKTTLPYYNYFRSQIIIISYPAPYQYYTKPPSYHRLYLYLSTKTQQSKQDEVHHRQPTLHPCNNRRPLWDSCSSSSRHGCFCS